MPVLSQIAQIVARGDETVFGHVIINEDLCILLEVHKNHEAFAPKIGETLISSINHRLTTHPITNLDSIKTFLSLLKQRQNLKSLIIFKLVDNVIYIGLHGQGIVWIHRDGKIMPLLDHEGALSGYAKPDDLFILQGLSGISTITKDMLKDIVLNRSFDQIKEELLPFAVGQNANPHFTSAIIKIISDQPQESLPPPPPDYRPSKARKLPDIKTASISFFKNLKDKILSEEEEVYQNSHKQKTKRIFLTIAVILIILFILSVSFGVNNQFTKVKQEEYDKTIELVTHQYNEASSLVDLNPQRARDLLKEAKGNVDSLLTKIPQDSKQAQALKDWQSKIENEETVAAKIYKLTDIPLLFDLTIIKDNAGGSKLSLYNDSLVVLDTQNKRLYALTTEGKQGEVVAGPDIVKDTALTSLHGTNDFIINSDGIIRIDTRSNSSQTAVKKDADWGSLAGFSSYAGNLYLLDKTKNQIWKYISTESGFTEKKNYLVSDVQLDFSSVKDMVIDGSIYVLDGANILKFTQGRLDTFNLHGGMEKELLPTAIYTDDDAKNIYILDSAKGTVSVYDKDGVYKATYQSPVIKGASDLVVSEPTQKILILKSGKIYSIDIK